MNRPYTTVMQWESYPAVSHGGIAYGLKRDSFQTFLDLPQRVSVRMQLALGGVGANADPRPGIRSAGWSIVDPLRITRTPWSFQRYLRSSRAEWTVAKQAYVQTNSGWFSERSANYLASGRPVVTQETGFSQFIPTGEGLFAFSTLDEAVGAIESIEASSGAGDGQMLVDGAAIVASTLSRSGYEGSGNHHRARGRRRAAILVALLLNPK